MAFVGPRPLLVSYLELYNDDQHKRHNVRPGFTCIAAVKGRNTLPWAERLKLDTYYAENQSFGLDLWIIIQTIFVSFKVIQNGKSYNLSCLIHTERATSPVSSFIIWLFCEPRIWQLFARRNWIFHRRFPAP